MLPSNLKLNTAKAAGYNNKTSTSNTDMQINLNKDIKKLKFITKYSGHLQPSQYLIGHKV